MTVAVSLDWLTNQNGETYDKFVPEGFRLRINSENFGAQAINLSFVVASVWPYRESLSIQNKLEWALFGQLLDSDFIPKMVKFDFWVKCFKFTICLSQSSSFRHFGAK